MQPVQVGKITVSRVEEMMWTISPRFLFPDLTYQDFEKHRDWLVPHFSAEDLKLRLSIHTFVVRTPSHTIIVDTVLCQKGLPLRHERFAVGSARDHKRFLGALHRG